MSADAEVKNDDVTAADEEEPLPQEVRYWLAWMDRFGQQDENGVDVVRLQANLRRTPTERIQELQEALRLVEEMDHARAKNQLRKAAAGTLRE